MLKFCRINFTCALFMGAQTFSGSAFAQQQNVAPCTWEQVGAEYGVSPYVLYGIARVESKLNPSAINTKNRNGSVDHGLMQINSVHLPVLAKSGITASTLMADSCANLRTGAWVMSKNIAKYGNTWTAVGKYNPGDPQYAGKVFSELRKIGAVQ